MSIESDVFTVLSADAAVAAIVADRISQSAMEEGEPQPYVVFSVAHDPQQELSGPAGLDQATVTIGCWERNAGAAAALADAVTAALQAYDATQTTVSVTVVGRQDDFDEATQLDGVVLAVEWWAQ